MKRIKVRSQVTVLIDNDDYDWAMDMGGWFINRDGYAVTDKRIDGKRKVLLMHRLIIKAPLGTIVDHINQNKLDNRKSNLRFATRSLNALNSNVPFSHGSTGLRGVSFRKQKGLYQAQIQINHKVIHLGFYDTPEKAHKAYTKKRLEAINV